MLLDLIIDTPDMPNAACRASNPETFFPDSSRRPDRADEAKAICAGCPERAACLEYALTIVRRGEPLHGIWGGTTAADRRELLKPTVVKRCRNGHERTPEETDDRGRCRACQRDLAARRRERKKVAA